MDNKTIESQTIMNHNDICVLLQLKDSTLRKYALILKNEGYKFHVNEHGQRGYFNDDIIVLKRFIETKENTHMTLSQAAKSVVSWSNARNVSVGLMDREGEKNHHAEDIRQLKETVEKQNELLNTLMKKMDEQQKHMNQQHEYIHNKLEKRDNLLMESLKDSMETRKQIAATEEKKGGFWSGFFGGK